MAGWQHFDTADTFECEECGTAWETERQAEDCGTDDRAEARFAETCAYCDVHYGSVKLATECEAGHAAEQASDRT